MTGSRLFRTLAVVVSVLNACAAAHAQSAVGWVRSGPDGSTYSSLGSGGRLPDGWDLFAPGLSGSLRVFVRAAGLFPTAQFNGGASMTASVCHAYFPIPFTDDPIVAGVTPVRAVHLSELRTRIDALLIRFNRGGGYPWSSGAIASGATVLAAHVAELRTALAEAYSRAGHSMPPFTDPIISPQTMLIRAVHLRELRAAIAVLEST